jgi:hypothetical protein
VDENDDLKTPPDDIKEKEVVTGGDPRPTPSAEEARWAVAETSARTEPSAKMVTRASPSFIDKHNNAIIAIVTMLSTLATIFTAWTAWSSLGATKTSVDLARETLKEQHRYNVLSVIPIPMLTVYNGEEKLEVKLRNNGAGPLNIRDIEVRDGNVVKGALIRWMPNLPEGIRWDNFATESKDRSVAVADEIILIRLLGKQSDPVFRGARDKCREALRKLTLTVKYTDIYKSSFDPHVRDLSGFGEYEKSTAATAGGPP